MPTGTVHARDVASSFHVKRRRTVLDEAFADSQQAMPPQPPVAVPAEKAKEDSTAPLDDIDADDPAALLTEEQLGEGKQPEAESSSDEDDEELLFRELQAIRAKQAAAASAAPAQRHGAKSVAARYDADVLFRFDVKHQKEGTNPVIQNNPTVTEFHTKFLKRFFR